MAKFPIEVIRIGEKYHNEISQAIKLMNDLQDDFVFEIIDKEIEGKFTFLNYRDIFSDLLIDKLNELKSNIKGFYPFKIFITDSRLKIPNYENSSIFGEADAREGIAVFTTCDVAEIIIPEDKMTSYFIYFLGRYILNFLFQDHKNHETTRECVFDYKNDKRDIKLSMTANAICDECRDVLTSPNTILSNGMYTSLQKIFQLSGQILREPIKLDSQEKGLPNLFIGSSSEGLPIARAVKSELEYDFTTTLWNQGVFDTPGKSYLEILEENATQFDFGLFIFSPDDKLESRGQEKMITRDNVIFELGLFVGKLSRLEAFILQPRNHDLHVLSDYSGIVKLDYDPNNGNLQSAVGTACEKIRKLKVKNTNKT